MLSEPMHNEAELQLQFLVWMRSECEIHPRVSGGLETLWKAFAAWYAEPLVTLLPREAWEQFMELVVYWRMPVYYVGETALVLGVALKVDTAFYPLSPAPSGEEERR